MTADSFDSPDGRTYSGPAAAAAPGQADEPGLFGEGLEPSPEAEAEAVPVSLGRIAHDGFYTARDSSPEACAANWNTGRPLFHTWWQGAGRAVADHLAAQEPHAADGFSALAAELERLAGEHADKAAGYDRDREQENFHRGCSAGLGNAAGRIRYLLGKQEPQPAPELAAAMDAPAALARVLSWFEQFGTRRTAIATRAQLAHAYQDGGLTVPEELRRFL